MGWIKSAAYWILGVIAAAFVGSLFSEFVFPPLRIWLIGANWASLADIADQIASYTYIYTAAYLSYCLVVFWRVGLNRYAIGLLRSLVSLRGMLKNIDAGEEPPSPGSFILFVSCILCFGPFFDSALSRVSGLPGFADPFESYLFSLFAIAYCFFLPWVAGRSIVWPS